MYSAEADTKVQTWQATKVQTWSTTKELTWATMHDMGATIIQGVLKVPHTFVFVISFKFLRQQKKNWCQIEEEGREIVWVHIKNTIFQQN
jgi:hypothetical protein